MPHIERIALDAAGSVQMMVNADGVVLQDLAVAPGWEVIAQHPRAGLLRRRVKPSPGAVVVLAGTGPDGPEERELEVNQLPDGAWERAVRTQRPVDHSRPISTPGGRVTIRVEGHQPRLVEALPSHGWTLRSQEQSEDDVVVVFAQGPEEWEVVVLLEEDGTAICDIDHRRQLGHIV